MRAIIISTLFVLSGALYFLFHEEQDVSVIDAHYDGSTALVIVDRLPFTQSKKISWWNKNQLKIREKYHIPSGSKGPFLIFVFAFGDGYQEEGREDKACFSDIKPPKNCIDKNILMLIWRTRDGGVRYEF